MKFRRIVVTVEPFDSFGDGTRTLKIETTVDGGPKQTIMQPVPEQSFETLFRMAVEVAIRQIEIAMTHQPEQPPS